MIIVDMNEDIRTKETQFIGPLTFRQLVGIAIGVSYGVPLFFAIPGDMTVRGLIALALASPALATGWIKMDGQHLEIIAIRFIYKRLLTPAKRRNRGTDYSVLREELKKEKEREMVKRMPAKKQKAYERAKRKNRLIRYSKKPENKIFK